MKSYYLAGLSAIAMAAGTAQAQDNTNQINSVGEVNTFICNNGVPYGSTSNVCTIDQTGDNNRALVEQYGNGNVSDIDQVGSSNYARHAQRGNNSTADTDQTGESNSSEVRQNSTATGSQVGNIAVVTQQGAVGGVVEQHFSRLDQGGRGNGASVTQSGVRQQSVLLQGVQLFSDATVFFGNTASNFNQATLNQSGNETFSQILQGYFGAGSSNSATVTLTNNGAAANTNGFLNRSFLTQNTSSNVARVFVGAGEATGLVADGTSGPFGGSLDADTDPDVVSGRNQSFLTQGGGDGNFADVSLGRSNAEFQALGTLRGNQQTSDIIQNGRDNYANVTITGGIAGNNTVAADATPGVNSEANRFAGNSARISQNGSGSGAVVTTGNSRQLTATNPRGFGNVINITQDATVDYQDQGAARDNVTVAASQDRLGYREFDTGPASRNFTGANGNYVETWQQGRFDTANVTQTDRRDTETGAPASGSGFVYSDGSIGRARAGVYQNSSVGTVNITQNGDNYGEVTQGAGDEIFVTTGSIVNLTQTDTGDDTRAGTAGETQVLVDQFGNPGQNLIAAGARVPVRQYNQAILTQNGGGQRMDVTQTARNGYVAAFQRNDLAQAPLPAPNQARGQTVDANNTLDLEQGTARSNLQAPFAPNALSGTGAIAGAAVNPTMNVLQGGRNNATQVSQDSSNSFVVVTQLGTGAAAAPAPNNFPAPGVTSQGGASANMIIVAQQGTGNRAEAAQEATVTASGQGAGGCGVANANCPASGAGLANEFVFAGGARSSEINIFQGGSNNTAVAVQRGAGQYARIEQSGLRNRAAIEQQQAATNATAVIRQTGNDNSYTIVQTLPGQYVLVNQTGDNVTTGVFSGPQGNTTFAPATFTRPSGT